MPETEIQGKNMRRLALLLCVVVFHTNFVLATDCDGPDPVNSFGTSYEFVGLVVCVEDFLYFQNVKMFRVLESLHGPEKLLLVAGSYGLDGRQEMLCEIGDTLLMQANVRREDFAIDNTFITVVEHSPLYYFKPCDYGYFEYKNGYCSYRYHSEEKVYKYSILKNEILAGLKK